MQQLDTGISAPEVKLLFADFLAYLHRQGFIIGVDHHLRLQALLNKLGPTCKPADLKFLLCPIFATNKKQQQQFYRSFDSYFKLLESGIAGKSIPEDTKKTGEDESPEEPVDTRKWPFVLTGVILIILVALLSYWWSPSQRTSITQKEQGEQVEQGTITGTNTGPGQNVVKDPSSKGKTGESPSQTGEGKSRDKNGTPSGDEPTFYQRFGHIIRWLAVLTPIIFLLLMEGYRYKRQRLMLEKQRGKKPPLVWPIKVESPVPALVKNEQFYQAARQLRERLKSDVSRLDIDKTISSTIRQSGFPVFRYQAVTRPPEYLILIDLPAYRDHHAHLFDSIANALENEGIFVERFFYEKDPRVCFKEPNGERFYFSDFKTRYSHHRLIVFGDGEEFLDPVSGELDKWTALFHTWRAPAVLTPQRPKKWGMREVALARKFIVLPASLNGLNALKDHWELRLKPDLKSWKLADSQALPPPMDDEYDTAALRDYLGEDTFQWLCACAVYPELHWDLTLYLGSLQCMPAALIREENVLRLIRLPWFRTGSMPDQLRWELNSKLDPDKNRAIRAAIIDLLEKNPAPRGSLDYDSYRLHLVMQRWMLSRKDRKRRREMIKSLETAPGKQIIQDYTMLRFMESAPRTPLSFILPKRLRKLFFRNGIPLLGFKAGIRVVLTILIAAAFFIFLKTPGIDQDIGFHLADRRINDKVQIFGSPLGMYSIIRGDYIIPVLKDDGSLDEEKLNKMAATIANMGANALRDYCWIDSQEAYKKISPFWHEGGRKFRFNEQFFNNQRRIAEICNKYNIRYYFSIFDHNGTKISKRVNVGEFNPWGYFDNFFYGEDAKEMRHKYIDEILKAYNGLDVGIELCNEPAGGQGEFLADTFIYLHKKGFPPDRIILGIDYHLQERVPAYGKDYREFRDKVADVLGREWRQMLKSVCISPFHNADERGIDSLWQGKAAPGGTRRVLYSMDGVRIGPGVARPDKAMMMKIARRVLNTKTQAREQGKVLFEIIYGKQSTDPLDSIEGVSEVYKEIWGKYPENYRKFPILKTPEL